MVEIDRRTAVLIAGVGLTGSPLRAQPLSSSFADDPEVSPDALSPELSFQPRNSVEFWNSVALELVAIDHTVDPKQARAIGPVATARALGLIHIVIADAVALAYPQPLYSPFLSRDDKPVAPSSPALFVGGAAAAIMEHIYANQAHTSFVNAKRREFLNAYGRRHLASWKAGLIFGRKDVYRSKYVFSEVDRLINPKTSTYVPGPQQHREDPLAPGQGYYGHSWGVKPDPFAISAEHVTKKITENGCAPVAPPAVGSAPYQRSADDVRAKGELKGDSDKPETITRTAQQSYPGLFWAYDGAAFIGTPLRLYNQILIAIARKDRLGPRRLARMLALCNIAMSDAGNVAWYAKYFHKYPRPVIGLNPNLPSSPTKADIKWIPLGSPKTVAWTSHPVGMLSRSPRWSAARSAWPRSKHYWVHLSIRHSRRFQAMRLLPSHPTSRPIRQVMQRSALHVSRLCERCARPTAWCRTRIRRTWKTLSQTNSTVSRLTTSCLASVQPGVTISSISIR